MYIKKKKSAEMFLSLTPIFLHKRSHFTVQYGYIGVDILSWG